MTAIATLNGKEERVRNSNGVTGQTLKLTFKGVTEAQVLQVVTHYAGQKGTYLSFAIPDALLAGLSSPSAMTLSGYSWKYASQPEIEDFCEYRNLSVQLEMVRI